MPDEENNASHARQRTDIHMQFTAGADAVGGITAVQATEVQRWVRYGERIVVVTLFQRVTQLHAEQLPALFNGTPIGTRILA